jgi:protease-4
VWTGAQARERGLVDDFGGLQAAVDDAAKRAKLGKPDAFRVRYIEREATPFERFFAGLVGSRAGSAWLHDSSFAQGIARTVLARGVPQMSSDLKFLDAALERRPGAPVKALAYCFCEL